MRPAAAAAQLAATAGRRQVFVYYRVDHDRAGPVATAMQAFQATLQRQWPALHAALLQRPDVVEGQVTLMETYATDAARRPLGVDESLQAHIELAAGPALAAASGRSVVRHVEVFETCTVLP